MGSFIGSRYFGPMEILLQIRFMLCLRISIYERNLKDKFEGKSNKCEIREMVGDI